MGEHYEQIGGQLKSAREAAGLDVDDVVFKTQIPKSVVEALEAENFSVFTSPVYAKSFLKQYSDFLHVDAEPWLNALEPGSFMPGGHMGSLLDGPAPLDMVDEPAHEHRGGLLSVLGLLTLSAALVVGAIKGYEFFERRFGTEDVRPMPVTSDAFPPAVPGLEVEARPANAPGAEAAETANEQPAHEPETEAADETEDEILPQPPLRAIPVERAD